MSEKNCVSPVKNVSGTCRACLTSCENMKFVSQEEAEGQLLMKLFISLNNIEWIHDETSSYLCKKCEVSLESAYEFQQRCLHNNKIINSILNGIKVEEKHKRVVIIRRKRVQPITPVKVIETHVEVTELPQEPIMLAPKPPEKYPFAEVFTAIANYKKKWEVHNKCVACSQTISPNQLKLHMHQEHLEIFKMWCPNCNELFENLTHHFNQMHRNVLETCVFCANYFKKSNYINHLYTHAIENLLKCPECPENFTQQYLLIKHSQQHHSQKAVELNVQEEKKVSGHNEHDYCQITAGAAESTTSKTMENPFTCLRCDISFPSEGLLATHLKGHAVLARYTCRYCDKPFKHKTRLVEHEMVHTGERRFKCPICDKGFIKKHPCQQHVLTHDPLRHQKKKTKPMKTSQRDNPFLCTKCGKTFRKSCNLVEHMKVHGDLEFSCIDSPIKILKE